MLEVTDLSCGYGDIVAARNLDFTARGGEVIAIIGANGAGKSSTLMCLCGLVEQHSGKIKVDSVDISNLSPEQRIRHGLAIVPEGRRVFADLTVLNNLVVGGHITDRQTLEKECERAFQYFPRLRERQGQLAGSLSGGEQQMLWLALR